VFGLRGNDGQFSRVLVMLRIARPRIVAGRWAALSRLPMR
jgi:hypothetical protein